MNIYKCGTQGFICNCRPYCPWRPEPCPPPRPNPCPPPAPFPPYPCPPPCVFPCPPACRTDFTVRTGSDGTAPQVLPASVTVNVPDFPSTLAFPTLIQEYGNAIVYNPSSKTFLLDEGYYLVTLRTTATAPAVTDTVVYAGISLSVGGSITETYTPSASGAAVTNEVFINQFVYVTTNGTILTFFNNSRSQPSGTGSDGNTIQYSNTTVNIVKLI